MSVQQPSWRWPGPSPPSTQARPAGRNQPEADSIRWRPAGCRPEIHPPPEGISACGGAPGRTEGEGSARSAARGESPLGCVPGRAGEGLRRVRRGARDERLRLAPRCGADGGGFRWRSGVERMASVWEEERTLSCYSARETPGSARETRVWLRAGRDAVFVRTPFVVRFGGARRCRLSRLAAPKHFQVWIRQKVDKNTFARLQGTCQRPCCDCVVYKAYLSKWRS